MAMTVTDQPIEIPGQADAHRWLSDGDGALRDAITHTQLKAGGVSWHFDLDENNVHRVESLYRLSLDFGAELHFSLASEARLDPATRDYLSDFVRRVLFEDPRRSPSQYQEDDALLREIAPQKDPTPGTRVERVARILYQGCRALVREAIHRDMPDGGKPGQIKSPVLIGVYGGEHVGDAAILGGVLLDLCARYGTRRVLLGSFRPAHTERLVRSLDVPVAVQVFHYDDSSAVVHLRNADALVFAGGPLMELPNLLVKHWNAAIEARRRALPFIIDRIGVGPFATWPGRFVARRIARLATTLSVRTSGAARQPELRGLGAQIKCDPAFSYLEGRGQGRATLTKLRPRDQQDVESLLEGAEEKFKVGINLRPIRHLWSPRGKTASRHAEAQCLERVAEAIVLVAEKIPTRFIFFPMNPIQLGGSDLHSAWQLHNLVGRRADFRVWQGDPEIDGLLSLLRCLDAAVTMRFHACIFALSQGVPTLGIDYYSHAGGKVGELFSDRSLVDDATRIDTLETHWLVQKLEAFASAAGYEPNQAAGAR